MKIETSNIISNDIDVQGNKISSYIKKSISKGYIADIISQYSDEKYVFMLIGGKSSSKVFSEKAPEGKNIIGIILETPIAPEVSSSTFAPNTKLEVQQIHINTQSREIFAGAAVTLDQISIAAQQILGNEYRVPGTDLTSRIMASSGGTFMTNGAGLKRINFGNAALSIRLYDGQTSRIIDNKKEIELLAGTYGFTGIVEEIKMQAIEVPKHDFRFAIPVNNNAQDLAKIIEKFGKKTDINIENGKIITDDYVVDGIELVTEKSIINQDNSSSDLAAVQKLLKSSGKNALVFVTGYSHKEFLEDENNWDENFEVFLNEFPIEKIHPFDNVDEMRKIREKGPEDAKSQKLKIGEEIVQFQHSESTDINVVVNHVNLRKNSELVLICYDEHKKKVLNLLEENKLDGLVGNLNMYGHLNPQGLDLHYRVTIGENDKENLNKAKSQLKKYYNELVQKIAKICQETDSKFTGGEKGAKSNTAILDSLTGKNISVANDLKERYSLQIKAIENSSPVFNWRAKKMIKQNPAELAETT